MGEQRIPQNPLMQATQPEHLIYTPLEGKGKRENQIMDPKLNSAKPHRTQCRWALGINDRRTQHGPLLVYAGDGDPLSPRFLFLSFSSILPLCINPVELGYSIPNGIPSTLDPRLSRV